MGKAGKQQRTTLHSRIRRLLKDNPLALLAFEKLERDAEVQTLLEDTNRMAIDRLGYSDHGHTHSLIVTKNAIELLKALGMKVQPTIVQEGTGTYQDAQVIVILSAYLHDIGMSVHRERHNEFSICLSISIVNRILQEIYPENLHKQIHIRGHVLHAIYSHDKLIEPTTIEAGIVGIADALDMTAGRARIPFQLGSINIHSASAMAIRKVRIKRGTKKTVRIEVEMSNATGIFQIQELLEKKIRSAPHLANHIELYAIMTEVEERILAKELSIL